MIDLIFLGRFMTGVGISILIFAIVEFMIRVMHVRNANQRFHLYTMALLSSFLSILYAPFLVSVQVHRTHLVLSLPNIVKELESTFRAGLLNTRGGSVFVNLRLIFLILMVVSLLFFMCALFLSKFYVKRRLHAEKCTDEVIVTVLKKVCRAMNIKVPEVVMVDGLNAFVFGVPAVLAVGRELVRNCNEKELHLVLRHEMNHIKNHDNILKPFLFSLRIFFFVNPVVHVVSRKIVRELEFLADNVSEIRKDRVLFLYTLARLSELHIEKRRLLFHVASSPLVKPNLKMRTDTLLSENKRSKWYTYCISLWIFTLLVVAGAYVPSGFLSVRANSLSDDMAFTRIDRFRGPAEFAENVYRHCPVLTHTLLAEPRDSFIMNHTMLAEPRDFFEMRPEGIDNPPDFADKMSGGLYRIDVKTLIAAIVVISLLGGLLQRMKSSKALD